MLYQAIPNAGPLSTFDFRGERVRVTILDGDPWWVAADVCSVLDISNPTMALERLDSDEKGTLSSTEGGPARRTINEPGLYSLILGSRKSQAKAFKRWITHEVIPAIRKTGRFSVAAESGAQHLADLSKTETLRLALAIADERDALKATIGVLAPKASGLDRIAAADGSLCISTAAKCLKVPPSLLFRLLFTKEWIFRRQKCAPWTAYQERIDSGMMAMKVATLTRSDGSKRVFEQAVITAKGLAKLAKVVGVERADS